MRRIWISDITMKQPAEAGGYALSFREKIEFAKLLDRLSVSVIEVGPIVSRKTDSLLVKSLASAIGTSTLAVPIVAAEEDSPALTWAALREAKAPRLQVVLPVSTVQMEYLCHEKPAAVLQRIAAQTAACRALCPEVEFVAEDAGRSEPEFLRQAIAAAVTAGAGIVTVCDTAGTLLPDEFFDEVTAIRAAVPAEVRLGVRCANTLFMADSCALAAVRAGADEVKTAACGGFTASLSNLTHILAARGSVCDATCGVRLTELQRAVDQLRWMCETGRSKTSAFDNDLSEEQAERGELELTIRDDLSTVLAAAARLGYDLSEEDGPKVYEAFTRIAGMKKIVGARELDAIIASAALQVPPTYKLESYVINCGDIITATCHMKLRRGEQVLESVCVGDGPVDASLLAVEQIVGRHYELDDFQIQAVTEGREAMGEAVVRLRADGKVYSGRGISTDIIGSSIRAYLSAVNKIVYEEAGA